MVRPASTRAEDVFCASGEACGRLVRELRVFFVRRGRLVVGELRMIFVRRGRLVVGLFTS